MKLETVLDRFGGHEGLQSEFRLACAENGLIGGALAVVAEDGWRTVVFGSDAAGDPFNERTPVRVGCTAKLFVSALIGGLLRGGSVGLDDPIARYLGSRSHSDDDQLARITIRQLLSHMDGIGYRGIECVPTTSSGYVDTPQLAALIASDAHTFAPGERCIEGHCGFGLLGALLERQWNAPLTAVLREELFKHLDHEREGSDEVNDARQAPICPASGRNLRLNAVEFAQFLRMHLKPTVFSAPWLKAIGSFAFMFERQADLPGWHPTTTGCALGWKTFAGGWVGHNGVTMSTATAPEQTVYVRLNPVERVALAWLAMGHTSSSTAALARLFGGSWPALKGQVLPRLLSQSEASRVDQSRYTGTFGNRARRVQVIRTDRGLKVATRETEASHRVFAGEGTLVPAANHCFFVRPPNTTNLFFVQYLDVGSTTDLNFIWDIRTLWGRTPETDPAHAVR